MILTPKMIDTTRRYWRIDKKLERMLLKQLGTEPYPHVYTEQDLYEQSRKMIIRYNENYDNTPKSSAALGRGYNYPKNNKLRR